MSDDRPGRSRVHRTGPAPRGAPVAVGAAKCFRAWDPRLEREVALKMLHARAGGDPDRPPSVRVGSARRERPQSPRTSSRSTTPSIDGEQPFIVSEVIDGGTLREELRRGPVARQGALDLRTQVADALSARTRRHRAPRPEAREHHGDADGRVKIVDFGLARSRESRASDGRTPTHRCGDADRRRASRGHGPYMSPEQTQGVRSDFRRTSLRSGADCVRDADRPASVPEGHAIRDDARHRP